ncbi:3-oxoadipyl-CoA thiolase [Blastochloris sulfoviridis]|uniref:Beta-ketothiolase n=1 Tax=Blastochloris sulfoviridis TaxID=50712 RepID=A0A5M6I5M8_9HYPH|nr:3-oxoadipyl-CoA thiolase [Blastochloris sulfoviridis]KAA5603530.1 3-oxoadipyl-CoA thiolase [Blastochloris sulfoviridis]
MLDACIYNGVRTPFGRHAGALAQVRPDDMAAQIIRAALAGVPFAPDQVEDVILGCACQAGEDGRNIGRHAALLAGLPVEVAGATVNRLCGSGLNAVVDAARAITLGEADLIVAGGVESMTRAPFVMAKSPAPFGREVAVFDTTIGARFANPQLVAAHGNDSMPETADNVARELGIGRDAADRFALVSQQRVEQARREGFFAGEIAPVAVPGRKGAAVTVVEDEHPRPDTTLEQLMRLRPLAEGGTVTAGNASGINDGACALVIGSRALGETSGAAPLATIRAAAVAGVPPRIMGIGPAPAAAKALARAGLTLADMDVIEINEAFAVQVLGCCQLMGLDAADSRLNPNGGAIALGHPLGATGARLMLTAARQLARSGGRYALVAMCIGVGQGIAAVIERG